MSPEQAQELFKEIQLSNTNRGRKFRHFQLMLKQIIKISKVRGEMLQKYAGPTWTDIADIDE